MDLSEYRSVLGKALQELNAISDQRESLDVEMSKLRQFIFATVNMLPDDERATFFAAISEGAKENLTAQDTLADAIRETLYDSLSIWFTVAQLRDKLKDSGFDFQRYTNPLASVSTTARRLVPADVEMTEIDGVTAYRALNTEEAIRRDSDRRQFKMLKGIFGDSFTDEQIRDLMTDAPSSTGETGTAEGEGGSYSC
jgi:hypothetical protein